MESANWVEEELKKSHLSIRKFAKSIGYSVGYVSEAVTIAEGLRAYPAVEGFKTRQEAITYIKEKRHARLKAKSKSLQLLS